MNTNLLKVVRENLKDVRTSGVARKTICEDGFTVSIQWSEFHYSSTRLGGSVMFPSMFELGYPSKPDELITPYAEDPENLTETVYPWVEEEVVEALLQKHGGVKGFR